MVRVVDTCYRTRALQSKVAAARAVFRSALRPAAMIATLQSAVVTLTTIMACWVTVCLGLVGVVVRVRGCRATVAPCVGCSQPTCRVRCVPRFTELPCRRCAWTTTSGLRSRFCMPSPTLWPSLSRGRRRGLLFACGTPSWLSCLPRKAQLPWSSPLVWCYRCCFFWRGFLITASFWTSPVRMGLCGGGSGAMVIIMVVVMFVVGGAARLQGVSCWW